ncbi:tyrosine-type recombinase/integrase [Planobispora takensis]|uniref:Recombinase n=1 Tax=Planobispora takensis TaxID=1367882 RepID=A0A8J3T843_9ACTN|nr:tyrosine-type recombinase/integrase [Planobispora takensis]GII06181.1 recombinase [Planobispora takensis]
MAHEGRDTPTAGLGSDLAVAAGPMEVLLAWQTAGSAAGPEHRVSPRVAARILGSIPAGTRRAYTADWTRFTTWCAVAERRALPCTAETLAEFISAVADQGYAPASLGRMLAAIRSIHRLGGQPLPDNTAASAVIKCYRNERAAAGIANTHRRAVALSVRQLRQLVAACELPTLPDGPLRPPPAVARDRLVLVLGWAMMARRGELHALDLQDVSEVANGLEVLVRRSKTDQGAHGHLVAIPYGREALTCPVRLWRAWSDLLAGTGITTGALFRRVHRSGRIGDRLSDQGIYTIIRDVADRAGLGGSDIRPHSLRAGGATGAYLGGADAMLIGRHGRWRDGSRTVLGYIRDIDRWAHNPLHGAGL